MSHGCNNLYRDYIKRLWAKAAAIAVATIMENDVADCLVVTRQLMKDDWRWRRIRSFRDALKCVYYFAWILRMVQGRDSRNQWGGSCSSRTWVLRTLPLDLQSDSLKWVGRLLGHPKMNWTTSIAARAQKRRYRGRRTCFSLTGRKVIAPITCKLD